MATDTKVNYLGKTGTEQIVANVKNLLADKQPKGDYALAKDVPKISASIKNNVLVITT